MSEHRAGVTVSEKHPGTQKQWLPGIEALRGLAALTVVVHHSWSLSTMPRFHGYWVIEGFGTWGVDLFFMLSGYLLAETFWQPKRANIPVYFIRRFTRIAPAYYVNVTLLFLFFAGSRVLFSDQGKHQVLASYTFTHYLFPNYSSSLNVNGALWTLTIEMMLYLFLPLMALAVRYAPVISLAAFVVIGVGWKVIICLDGGALRNFYFGHSTLDAGIESLFISRQFIGALPVFALGIGARWMVTHGHMSWIWGKLPSRLGVLSFVVLAIPSLLLLHQVEPASDYHHKLLFPVFDFLLMLLMLPALLLAARPAEFKQTPFRYIATWLGVRSYSIYLWHFPIILAVYERGPFRHAAPLDGYAWRLPIILVLTLIFGAASYALVERPGMDFGRRLSKRISDRSRPRELVTS